MDFNDSHKKEIETRIVEIISSGLEKGDLKEEESKEIADFVLGRIDLIKNRTELEAFLSQLSSKWQVFKVLESLEKGETRKRVENEVAEGVLTLAKNGKINEALNLAKTMTRTS